MFCVYILKLVDNSYYIGSTNNLEKRLQYHLAGRVKSTKHKLPFESVYTEFFETRKEASVCELQIKKWKSRKAIEKLIDQKN